MEKEFKQLNKLADDNQDYLDLYASIDVIDAIINKIDKVMVTRVKDYFDQVYQPKFDFKVTTGKVTYNCGDHNLQLTFNGDSEKHVFDIGLNTTKRKYTCNFTAIDYMSQSCTLNTLLVKIEKEAYAASKAAKKSKKSVNVNVSELIDFHSHG